MAKEELGKKTEEEGTENPEEAPKGEKQGEGQESGADGGSGDVTDKHGQPGINKERHDKEVAELRAEIDKLKGEAAEAADAKAKREEFEKKAAALEAKMADTELSHKLEMAGCVDLKAAKARLDDFEGDVSKLKSECPYLFAKEKQTGSTGKPPAGPSAGIDEKLDKAFGLK